MCEHTKSLCTHTYDHTHSLTLHIGTSLKTVFKKYIYILLRATTTMCICLSVILSVNIFFQCNSATIRQHAITKLDRCVAKLKAELVDRCEPGKSSGSMEFRKQPLM